MRRIDANVVEHAQGVEFAGRLDQPRAHQRGEGVIAKHIEAQPPIRAGQGGARIRPLCHASVVGTVAGGICEFDGPELSPGGEGVRSLAQGFL